MGGPRQSGSDIKLQFGQKVAQDSLVALNLVEVAILVMGASKRTCSQTTTKVLDAGKLLSKDALDVDIHSNFTSRHRIFREMSLCLVSEQEQRGLSGMLSPCPSLGQKEAALEIAWPF